MNCEVSAHSAHDTSSTVITLTRSSIWRRLRQITAITVSRSYFCLLLLITSGSSSEQARENYDQAIEQLPYSGNPSDRRLMELAMARSKDSRRSCRFADRQLGDTTPMGQRCGCEVSSFANFLAADGRGFRESTRQRRLAPLGRL